ncbi:unnamed protein product [Penicillium nalgiovense]|nr:unnamed protein product [Penicillium nalgiovense]
MVHPISPSPNVRPAKRQRRVSQDPEDKPRTYPQQCSNGTTIEPKVVHTLLGRKRTKTLILRRDQ